jgi:hypothetical protein
MQSKYHWSNYYKHAELLTISAYIAIPVVGSVLNALSLYQHVFTLLCCAALFYIEKVRGFVPVFFIKFLRTKMGGNLRSTQKYHKPN